MKPATETILTRVFITLMSLFTTMAVGHRLGAQGLGEVSLIVLGITVVMLMSSIVGGGAVVYFASRTDRYRLLVPSYAWVALTAGVAWILLRAIPVLPPRYITAVVVLATLQGVFTWPETQNSLVPALFLAPKPQNQAALRRRMVGATAIDSTLLTVVGQP